MYFSEFNYGFYRFIFALIEFTLNKNNNIYFIDVILSWIPQIKRYGENKSKIQMNHKNKKGENIDANVPGNVAK